MITNKGSVSVTTGYKGFVDLEISGMEGGVTFNLE